MQNIQSECAWLFVGNDKPNIPDSTRQQTRMSQPDVADANSVDDHSITTW